MCKLTYIGIEFIAIVLLFSESFSFPSLNITEFTSCFRSSLLVVFKIVLLRETPTGHEIVVPS